MIYQTYGLESSGQANEITTKQGSNRDLADFLKKPKNRSQMNVLDQADQSGKRRREDQLEINSSD